MKKGLALCGGGAKGSYEAGCFKAFEELGISFDIVTGTSIGCLNAAMYCQHDLDRDYELWQKLTVNMVMKYGFNFDRLDILNGIKNNKNSIAFLLQYVTNRGADIRPLKQLFDQYINPKKIQESDVTFGVVTAQQGSLKGVEVVANKLDLDLIPQYILASASAWPIFPICKIGDKSFVDGGYYDNLPINYALKLGADEVVAIDLNVIPIHPEYLNVSNVKYIKPTHSLGGFMRYDHKQIVNNMSLGYLDTMKAYGHYIGYRHCFFKDKLPNLNYKSIFQRIIEIYSNVSKNQIKQSKKADYQQSILEFYSEFTDSKKLTGFDYFIRSLEVLADYFDISYYEAHHPLDLLNDLAYKVNEVKYNKNLLNGLDKLKNIEKKRAFIEKINDLDLLRYLFEQIKSDVHVNITILSLIYSTKMKVLVSYILLEFSMKEEILYDFKKED